MKAVLVSLLLAALSNSPTPTPAPSLGMPPGTIVSINATLCLSKEHMNALVDTEVQGGDVKKVFSSLSDCDSFCITAGIVSEVRRFTMQDGRLFAVFEIVGLNGSSQSFWAATAIGPDGWPLKMPPGANDKQCAAK